MVKVWIPPLIDLRNPQIYATGAEVASDTDYQPAK